VRRPTFAFAPDLWDQPPEADPAPVECTECSKTDCACGESTYECDSCRRMVPVAEIRSVRNTSAGQGEFCERCLGMDAATSRDAAGIP
jgi:hypothetical protein